MKKDNIIEIGIDESGRLCIKPEKEKFPYLYRTATEVHWDEKLNLIYSPKPREWTYLDWDRHIISTMKNECNFILKITPNTQWIAIPDELKSEIIKCNNVA